jgi:hypothetical protein
MTTSASLSKAAPSPAPRAKFKSWRILVPILFAAVNAVMCAGPGSLAAPVTLSWFEPLICPAGQEIAYEYAQAAGTAAGQLSQVVYCQDGAGQRTWVGNQALGVMMGSYFAIFLLPALVIGLTAQFGKRGAPRPLGWEAEQEVRALIADGRQAQAAKLVREKTGSTPKWAREYIDVMTHVPETVPSPRPAAPAPSALDKLKQLKEMLDAGLISAKDYDAKKTDILGQI